MLKVQEDQLKYSLDSLRSIKIGGFNVTMPHKVKVLDYVDRQDNTVQLVGAANTVNNEDGKFCAYNTDVIGFMKPLHDRKVDFNGFEVFIFSKVDTQSLYLPSQIPDRYHHPQVGYIVILKL